MDELAVAKRQAEQATAAKSRFLAAASHDLRQPLQTLALVQGLLVKNVEGEKGRKLLGRLDETLGAMSGMLNALLDINQIESGIIHAEVVTFPVADLLNQLREEFIYHAQAKGLGLRVIPCSLSINSDPRLLEQMLRNLVSNALKYTQHGRVLLGCRRHESTLSIQVWDTGIGIPDDSLEIIFEEYQQLDNPARERSLGLGLGLSIVHHLGFLLGHPIHVRSRGGKGSMFSVDVPLQKDEPAAAAVSEIGAAQDGEAPVRLKGTILVIEDDPDVRELLEALLIEEGHKVTTASDGIMALDLAKRGMMRPDLILADFNLPTGMDGVRATALLRDLIHHAVPALILTGDISTQTSGRIAQADCERLSKPVKPEELAETIQRLLARSEAPVAAREPRPDQPGCVKRPPVIFVVDDNQDIRSVIRTVLEEDGREVEAFGTSEAFLQAYRPGREDCLIIDAYLPGMNGIALLGRLREAGYRLPAIMITGHSDVPMAVEAMKAGAIDFIEKPVSRVELLASVDRALEQSRDSSKVREWQADAAAQMAGLTPRQREIMDRVLAGQPSKIIAADLGISQRTVENHRASIMTKTGTRSLPALARLALAAAAPPAAD
jgi:two-component system CheB/CheR fusion protein